MAEVIWLPEALVQLDAIRSYVGLFDPAAADRLVDRLEAAGNSLVAFPRRGRPAGVAFRELTTVPPYVIRYRVVAETAYITSVKHGRQRRPD